jgi:hypothetical protein
MGKDRGCLASAHFHNRTLQRLSDHIRGALPELRPDKPKDELARR